DPGARATMLPPQTGSLNGIVHEPKIVAPWAIVTSVLRFIGSSEVATNAAPLDGTYTFSSSPDWLPGFTMTTSVATRPDCGAATAGDASTRAPSSDAAPMIPSDRRNLMLTH